LPFPGLRREFEFLGRLADNQDLGAFRANLIPRPLSRPGASTPFARSFIMSIPTPKVRAPQGKSAPVQAVSAAALLAGATKKGKTTTHLVYTGEAGQEAAARWLELNAQFAETERELALVRDRVLDVVRPWYEETCARRRTHESMVVVETPTGALRVSFQHRYAKLALDREEHLRQVLADDFERLFKRTVSLKVKRRWPRTRPSSNRWSWPWPRRWGRTTSRRCSRWSRRWRHQGVHRDYALQHDKSAKGWQLHPSSSARRFRL
jgi:hypothetical protein